MRTKTLLLGAAALAAGILSSQAQNVYSQNVVGYVQVTAAANQFILVANPLTTGNDVISNVLQSLPSSTEAQIWNGSGFTTVTYSGVSHSWKIGAVVTNTLPLPVGAGFFLYNATAPITNTFVGSVVPNVGASVTNTLTGGVLTAVGEKVPFSDTVTNASDVNLLVPSATTLQEWNPGPGNFTLFTYSGVSHAWKIGSTVTNPVVSAAEAFFITPAGTTNWVQTLP
jgi:hypothetical protein